MFTFAVDLVEDLFGGLGPDEWVLALVPAVNEGPDLDHQVADGGEGATVDGLLLDDGEPDLYQVQPGAGGGGEVDVDPRVGLQPGFDLGVLVGGVVVHHQVELLVGVGPRDVCEEGEELGVPVPVPAHRGDLAGGDLECGEQCGGAVPDVVVGALLEHDRAASAASSGSGPGLESGFSRRYRAKPRSSGAPGTAR